MGRTLSAPSSAPLVPRKIIYANDFFQWMSIFIVLLLVMIWSRLGHILEAIKRT